MSDAGHIIAAGSLDRLIAIFVRLDFVPTKEGIRIVPIFQGQKFPPPRVSVYQNIAYFSLIPNINGFWEKTSLNISFVANTMPTMPAQIVQHVRISGTNVFFDNHEINLVVLDH
jgi:hypothetical protein